MNPPELPPELGDLERQLVRRAPVPAGLRSRVLACVAREVRRAAERRRLSRWAAAVAAAALVGSNFAASAAVNVDWRRGDAIDPTAHEAMTRRLGQLLPDLPESERQRQAALQLARERF